MCIIRAHLVDSLASGVIDGVADVVREADNLKLVGFHK